MCGIVGYVGPRQAAPLLLDGLRRLEYRGYDSAGVAVANGSIRVLKAEGNIDRLASLLQEESVEGSVGIGHTRWATHGEPSDRNAHPHTDPSGSFVVVHNGIIENHRELKDEMQAQGRVFESETDTEIIAHLVSRERERGAALPDAVRGALSQVRGAYAIAVLDRSQPDMVVAAKNASPLVVGLGKGENFLASDVPAILNHTRRMVFLGEGEMAVLTSDGVSLMRVDTGEEAPLDDQLITWSPAMAEKGGYKHYMLKEIHEQPRAVTDTLRGRVRIEQSDVDLTGLDLPDEALAAFSRVVILACGTSWHAGMVGEYLIERFARIPVEVELASEFRYRSPVIDEGCLVVAISQSGETADTIAAMREIASMGAHILTICNVVGSTMTRMADSVLMTLAGPEISVASTKAFTTQIVALYLLGVKLARVRGTIDAGRAGELLQDLIEAPSHMEVALHQSKSPYLAVARRYHQAGSFLYLGRGLSYPMALEGALKLKELSYIHAEGYAAGEMKHGPIALIEETLPTVVVCPAGGSFDKTLGNMSEIKARGGPVVAITTIGEAAERVVQDVDTILTVPDVPEHVQPLILSIPLQLLAYHLADFKGTDVDQPRNLAKSVTVE